MQKTVISSLLIIALILPQLALPISVWAVELDASQFHGQAPSIYEEPSIGPVNETVEEQAQTAAQEAAQNADYLETQSQLQNAATSFSQQAVEAQQAAISESALAQEAALAGNLAEAAQHAQQSQNFADQSYEFATNSNTAASSLSTANPSTNNQFAIDEATAAVEAASSAQQAANQAQASVTEATAQATETSATAASPTDPVSPASPSITDQLTSAIADALTAPGTMTGVLAEALGLTSNPDALSVGSISMAVGTLALSAIGPIGTAIGLTAQAINAFCGGCVVDFIDNLFGPSPQDFGFMGTLDELMDTIDNTLGMSQQDINDLMDELSNSISAEDWADTVSNAIDEALAGIGDPDLGNASVDTSTTDTSTTDTGTGTGSTGPK